MKFLLIGCNGKMGKQIAEVVKESESDKIVAGVDLFASQKQDFPIYSNIYDITCDFDAIIDFSTSQDRKEYIKFAENKKSPYGCFSTICSDGDKVLFQNLSQYCPVLFCKNASLGVNTLYKLVEIASKSMPNADVVLTEYHHKAKVDAPSGTAKNIEKIFALNNVNFTTSAFRVGSEKGTHSIKFFLEDEILEIKHTATSRKIFALGAISLMHKLIEKENAVYYEL